MSKDKPTGKVSDRSKTRRPARAWPVRIDADPEEVMRVLMRTRRVRRSAKSRPSTRRSRRPLLIRAATLRQQPDEPFGLVSRQPTRLSLDGVFVNSLFYPTWQTRVSARRR